MPSPKSHRRGVQQEEKNRNRRLSEKASSFHGWSPSAMDGGIPRPKTVPDLLSGKDLIGMTSWNGIDFKPPKLTKLLLNVTIDRSLGPVQVLLSPESTVGDLISAAIKQYAKEGRRPILPTADPCAFDLHYSQFSLESLDREEKVMNLGSRNFFLCAKRSGIDGTETTSSSSCSKQAEKVSKINIPWLKFMDFLF
ncbi:hypothetical protein RJ641_033189 [Dillenia turbinata]|uniref:DUF7054 domain-containing protein n=1 Tax=Dillenia turbinata TaxID=194707 RepID=A0AAN8VLV6_9MAGN